MSPHERNQCTYARDLTKLPCPVDPCVWLLRRQPAMKQALLTRHHIFQHQDLERPSLQDCNKCLLFTHFPVYGSWYSSSTDENKHVLKDAKSYSICTYRGEIKWIFFFRSWISGYLLLGGICVGKKINLRYFGKIPRVSGLLKIIQLFTYNKCPLLFPIHFHACFLFSHEFSTLQIQDLLTAFELSALLLLVFGVQ